MKVVDKGNGVWVAELANGTRMLFFEHNLEIVIRVVTSRFRQTQMSDMIAVTNQ